MFKLLINSFLPVALLILIGMASSFANHLLFVYPIALNEYEANFVIPLDRTLARKN